MQSIDEFLFHFMNYQWNNDFFDVIIPFWRNKYFWIPAYLFIIVFIASNFGKRAYFIILFLIITVGSADLISSRLIKKNVKRLRPCNQELLLEKRTLVRCGSGYSFTSSHAANHFALSFFLIFLFKDYKRWVKWMLFLWAFSISYGQVYVGVHYPIDIFFGAMLGISLAILWFYACNKFILQRNLQEVASID